MIQSDVHVNSVEIDPIVDAFAEKWFGLPRNNTLGLTRHVMDAVVFVEESAGGYDYIVHDVFSGGNVHPSLFSLAFLQKLKALLNPGGSLALVLPTNKISLYIEFLWICWRGRI